MPTPITATIPHSLGKDEARRRIAEGIGGIKQQLSGGMLGMFKIAAHWEGDRLQFDGSGLGQHVTGRLDVLDDSVYVEIYLPPMLAALADRVRGIFQNETKKLLEKK